MSELVLEKKKKKKMNKWLLIGGFLLIAIALLCVIFYTLMNNPKYVIRQSVIRTFALVDTKEENPISTLQFGTTIKLGGNLVDDTLADDTLNIRGFIDGDNDKTQISGSVTEDGKKILSGSTLDDKGSNYIASDNLFDNVYNLDNYDCTGKDNLICNFIKVEDNSNDINIDVKNVSLGKAVDSLKNAVLDSISNDNVFRNKGTSKDEFAKYNKYTYKLDKDTVSKIYNNLDDSAYYFIYNFMYIFLDYNSFSEAKESIEEQINNINDTLEINIYTSGLLNNFVGIEIGNSSTIFNFSYNKETKKMNFGLPNSKFRAESIKNDEGVIVASLYYKDVLLGTINREKKDNATTTECKFNLLGMTINLNMTNKINTDTDDDLAGLLNVNLSLDALIYNFDFNLELDYNLSTNITIKPIETKDAIDYNDMSQEEKDKIESEMQNFYKTKIGQIFSFFGKDDILEDNIISDTF